MSIYPMMTNLLPKACIKDMHNMQENYMRDTSENKRYHVIKWEAISQHKYAGGLGLLKLDQMNQACMGKFVWQLHNNGEHLWFKVLRNKYKMTSLHEYNKCGAYSKLWNDIIKNWSQIFVQGSWSIGNRTTTNAWSDCWVDNITIIQDLNLIIIESLQNVKLKDIVNKTGEWDCDKLKSWMPKPLMHKIKAFLPLTSSLEMMNS